VVIGVEGEREERGQCRGRVAPFCQLHLHPARECVRHQLAAVRLLHSGRTSIRREPSVFPRLDTAIWGSPHRFLARRGRTMVTTAGRLTEMVTGHVELGGKVVVAAGRNPGRGVARVVVGGGGAKACVAECIEVARTACFCRQRQTKVRSRVQRTRHPEHSAGDEGGAVLRLDGLHTGAVRRHGDGGLERQGGYRGRVGQHRVRVPEAFSSAHSGDQSTRPHTATRVTARTRREYAHPATGTEAAWVRGVGQHTEDRCFARGTRLTWSWWARFRGTSAG
jgi:hypothetical protein